LSRSALLDLLPDFSSGGRRQAPPRAPGFEPLVQDAGSREEFSALGMPSGFPGLSAEPETDAVIDPFSEEPGLMPEIDMGEESPPLDLSDLAPAESDPAAGLNTEEPIDLMEEVPVEEPGDTAPDFPDQEEIGLDEESEETATGIAAHELLEAAHRAELNDIETAHRREIEELVSSRIPKLRDEVVETLAGELAPLLATCLREEQVARTLDVLVGEVTAALRDSGAVSFELRGPQNLLTAFEEKWPEESAPVKLVPADGVDLVARIDKTVISTRLSELDRLLQEALS
jgi:hypothetical protein